MASVNTRTKVPDKERAVSNTFSLPLRLHQKIEKRCRALGLNRSQYIKKLVEEDN
jgi:hypothetical protein